jgi:hypothetical protein
MIVFHAVMAYSGNSQLATWKSAPCAAEQAGIVLRGNESSANATVFSVADFARLFMLLTQDEEVRCALIASGKNLLRTELDAGARRDDFWSTTVAPRYNDGSLNISEMLFISSLEAVVEIQGESEPRPASATPIPRTGGELKEKFFRVRALFSECHRRRSVSGQMDPESFASFLPVRPVAEILHMDRRCMFNSGPSVRRIR